MIDSGKLFLLNFKKRWQLLEVLAIVLYALGPAILSYILKSDFALGLFLFLAIATAIALYKKPWRLTLGKVSSHIDQKYDGVEFSTGLLLKPMDELANMAMLQRYKIGEVLKENRNTIKPEVPIKKPLVILLLFVLLSFISYQFSFQEYFKKATGKMENQQMVKFQPLDSTLRKDTPPSLKSQKLTIYHPSYTKLGQTVTSNMNIKALEGSKLVWEVQFDTVIQGASIEILENAYPMDKVGDGYLKQIIHTDNGFYNFKFKDTDGAIYVSDLYAMEVLKDESPVIEIQGLQQFTSFDLSQHKVLHFEVELTDDFGVEDAYVIATVSKGEGESVKFREERLTFDDKLSAGTKKQVLSKKIDLDLLNMEPGDELYFYMVAMDTKRPKANISRSETFFAVIKDTVTNPFAVEGTMGADLMPDYFRSQRQLIIDTEKLLADQNKITKEKFNFTSNELGYDQKALRIKYGEFMGDEVVGENPATEEAKGDRKATNSDLLKEYTHDHDGGNEHNLVDHDHHEGEEEKEENPLESYLHNHDDPEESTLFTASIKSKLRLAMDEMWNAELYLRLYTPEKSLPYQYRALKLIQDIKNSARIYVHRIGFDPPPIKEDKRLSGTIDEVINYSKMEDIAQPEELPFIKKAVERLERLIISGAKLKVGDRGLFEKAGNELSILAIQEPGKYLGTLQQLKWISERSETSKLQLEKLQRALLAVIPKSKPAPRKSNKYPSEINELLLQELELNDGSN
ncbi:tryptophan-rich sensory protein [Sediminicola sp. 1XM1-17]|uniref:tryptophan-rich sensory protein n=1 Tax=Sediminicola sp. 1XM1-17 TaxID=3127702 RepID=UPI003077554D